MDLMDLPPIGASPWMKWKSHEDFSGRGKTFGRWVPRPDVRQPSLLERFKWAFGPYAPWRFRSALLDALSATIYGRALLTAFTPTGDLCFRACSDNVVTDFGKEHIRNGMRAAVAGYGNSLYYTSAGGSGSNHSGSTSAGLVALQNFQRAINGTVSFGSYSNPWQTLFLSTCSAAESPTENSVLAATFSPTRVKDAMSTSDLSKFNPNSGWSGADIYMRWDYSTGEANNTWYSVCFANTNGTGGNQAVRNLLAAPITKTTAQFLKVEYTISISLS